MNTLNDIKRWFELAKPEPTEENITTQLGAMTEEISEAYTAMKHFYPATSLMSLATVFYSLNQSKSEEFVKNVDREQLLDALCDIIVTAQGVAYMMDMDLEKALAEVNRSNWSKFEFGKPIFNEHGKIMKGKDYTPPLLKDYY